MVSFSIISPARCCAVYTSTKIPKHKLGTVSHDGKGKATARNAIDRETRGSTTEASASSKSSQDLRRRALISLAGFVVSPVARAADTFEDSELDELIKFARSEPDPEISLELWDDVIELDGGTASSLVARGNNNLLLGLWSDAVRDFDLAVPLLRQTRGGQVAYLPTGLTTPVEAVQEALALDGMGLATGALGNWDDALQTFEVALGAIGTSGSSEATIPAGTPFSGLRGGAASLGQRVELHSAFAKFAAGDTRGAVGALRRIDKGPNPDGFPQFWDARAALAIALWATGDRAEAEAEWAELCRPTPVPPPATPSNKLFAGVNKAAQLMLDAEGIMTDNRCESLTSGVFLPCDDAGIPGLGGSSAPCVLYTPSAARARFWPANLVAELEDFLK
ncbi:hypothetical protein CYMTET_39647 [Cymbomonas tetramitiformis]|uniref:Uncharacterized protein n=1 Tax=Cymbomonas tetramitiformis TaxID=36881 RepID=A0AAE0F3R3_9CHLO|nr:hypothetical protein CYMTET_39647 [Cymbomonas tetramitiformis]